jgi:hypothetical protein
MFSDSLTLNILTPNHNYQKSTSPSRGDTADTPLLLDDAEQSDGETAANKAKAYQGKVVAARRGPPNESMIEFHPPKAIVIQRKDAKGTIHYIKKWEFLCKHCGVGYVLSPFHFYPELTGNFQHTSIQPNG